MAQQIPDWLGPLVEAELQAAVDWYSPNIVKRDPDARFRDDGSNYHNVVESEKFSAESKVQIVQVLPDEDVMILSDGSTCLRTRLSARAKTALETELDGAIHADVRGDVFAIKKATLVSTPYGPGDRKVQLVVDDLQYHFMLRKITGQPQPVEKRPEVMRLIREMLRLRSPTQEPEARAEKRPKTNATMAQQFSRQKQPDDMHVQSPRSQVSVRSAAMRSSPSQIYTQLRDTRPVISSPMQVSTQTRDTRPAVGSSPPQVDTQMRDTQPTIATQAPIRRKKHGLNLQSDGVELAAGVNLERPTAAVQSYRLQSNLAAPLGMPGGLSDDKAQLLSVLGKRKAAPEAQAQNVTKPIAPKPVAPEAQGLPDYVDSPDADAGVAHALENGPEPMALPEYHGPSESSAPKTIATAFEQRNVTVSATPRPSYWRRPQPYAQRKLLDSPSSWFPSRPGREFPMPNVPIELLKVWNEQVEAQSLKPSQPPDVSQHIAGERAGEEAVDSESHSSASEDEELPWSSSPARSAPLKARPENQSKVQVGHLGMPLSSAPLSSSPQEPPDSSIGSRTGDGNPNRQDLPPDSSNDRVPYPLPRRPAFSPQKAQQQSPPSGQSNGQLSQQSAHSAAGSPMQIRPSTATPIRPKASSATQRDGLSQAFVKDVPSTQGMPTNPPSAIPRNSEGHSRPSTAGSVSAGNFVSTKSGSNSAQEAIAKAKSAAAERVASYEPRSAAPPSPNNQIRQSEIDHLQRARFPSSRTLINPARSGARPTSGDQNATQHSLPALTRPSSSSRPPAPVDRRPFETPNTPSYPRPESRSSAASQRWGDSYRPGYKHRSDTYRSDRRWSDAYRDDRSENDRPGSRGDTYRPTYLNRPNQPSSSASLMVKATQPSTHDPPSKDLETDIARPVDPTVRHEKGPPSKDLKTDVARPVDPAVQHQKRRSEHFKSIQRRDW